MGMTIDNAIKHMEQARYDYCEYWEETRNDTTIAFDIAIDTMRKYQQLQADYETRLKADMVAMLTEIQLEIEELDTPSNGDAYMTCSDIIQQKINALKENGHDD